MYLENYCKAITAVPNLNLFYSLKYFPIQQSIKIFLFSSCLQWSIKKILPKYFKAALMS